MSREAALGFMVKVMQEPALAAEVRQIDAKDLSALVKVAGREGFPAFNNDDYYFAAERAGGEWLRMAARMRGEAVSDELSVEELEQVAGGKGSSGLWSQGHTCCMISGMVTEPSWCKC